MKTLLKHLKPCCSCKLLIKMGWKSEQIKHTKKCYEAKNKKRTNDIIDRSQKRASKA